MSEVPGVFTTIDNTVVGAPAPLGEAIFMMGHLTASPAGMTKAATGTPPTVKSFSSFGDWITELGGALATDNWVEGIEGVPINTIPNDDADSLLRGLSLVYAANPAAKVYIAIIEGAITDVTSAPAGMAESLTEALKYQDIAYVIAPGYNPITEIEAHCALAANATQPYNSPRMYVTGIDLFQVWDTTAPISATGAPLTAADLAAWGNKSTTGTVYAYVGNHLYNFANIFTSTVSSAAAYVGSVEIGGQHAAAFLAGLLAAQNPAFTGTSYPMGLGQTYWDGSPYIFAIDELNEAMGDTWNITRFLNNSYQLGKGVTHTTDLSWKLLPHREVTNYIHKNLARTVSQFLGKQLNSQNLLAASTLANKFLGTAIAAGYISEGSASVQEHATEIDAIVIRASFTTVKPINKIYLNFSVS